MKIIMKKIIFFTLGLALLQPLISEAANYKYISFINYTALAIDEDSDFKPSDKKNKFVMVSHLNISPIDLGVVKNKKYNSTITQAIIFCNDAPKYLPIVKKYYKQEAGKSPVVIEDEVLNQDKYEVSLINTESINPPTKYSIEETVSNYSCAKAAEYDKSIKVIFKNPAAITSTISTINCTYSFYLEGRKTREKEEELELGIEKNTGKIFALLGAKDPTLIGFSESNEREIRFAFDGYPALNRLAINKYSGKLSGKIIALIDTEVEIKGNCTVGDKNLFASNVDTQKPTFDTEESKKKKSDPDAQPSLPQQKVQTAQTLPTSTDKRIALVIGNANYKYRPLRNPRNDADDISRSLRSSGFEVIDLRDASLQQMRAGVRQFGDRLINNDVGLVYYSGHGVEVKGRNYFIPVSTDILREDEIADQGLDVSLILEKMNTAGKGVNILIVDACRDDPFGRSFRSSSRGLAQMDAPRGTIIAYATSPGKVASDGEGRNSPYTKNLVKAIQQPNKTIEQVFKEVRRAVQEETKNQQIPWENTSLSGDFYFRVQR